MKNHREAAAVDSVRGRLREKTLHSQHFEQKESPASASRPSKRKKVNSTHKPGSTLEERLVVLLSLHPRRANSLIEFEFTFF